MQTNPDSYWMGEALNLACRGLGRTRPNPPVGAVLVADGTKVSAGYHSRAGGPHAEARAIAKAGSRARGATLYVTLEPCSTSGRTPPCTDAIIGAGISRVVIGAEDSNPVNGKKASAILRQKGIAVDSGCMKADCEQLLAPYRKWVVTATPYVTLKLAMTIDGKIADHHYHSKWITGNRARHMVGRIRRRVDAVLVGSQTAATDNPGLTDGSKGKGRLLRIVADTRGRTPPSSRIFRTEDSDYTIVATTEMCDEKRAGEYRSRGARIWTFPKREDMVSLNALMTRLGREGIHHVLCEGGGVLAAGLLNLGLVDECLFFLAPSIMGDEHSRPAVAGKGRALRRALQFKFGGIVRVGQDIAITAYPRSASFGVRGSVVSKFASSAESVG